VSQENDNSRESGSPKQTADDLLKSCKRSFEVTGLGIIASFIIAAWPLVGDGTLRLSNYLGFVSFLLVGAGGLAWRLVKLAPNHGAGLRSKNLLVPNVDSSLKRTTGRWPR
jgi:hypothetical protein